MRSERASGAGGFAEDECRGEGDFLNKMSGILDAVEQGLGGDGAHFEERLVHGCEGRDGERGEVDVVEADYGNILGNIEAGLLKDDHGADGGSVVIGEQSGERELGSQECLCRKASDIGSVRNIFKLNDELRVDGEIQLGGDLPDGVPARNGVGAESRPAKESDVAVTKVEQVLQYEPRGVVVIEDDVGDVGDLLMAGDGYTGESGLLVNGGVNGNDPFRATVEQ